MADTLWADISQFQVDVNDAYPYRALSFRSNDGTYRDPHFVANKAWCDSAIARGRLDFYIVYVVYEPDNEAWARTAISEIGKPSSRLVVMIDLESWGGRISGDHSADINAGRTLLAQWLGSSPRVIGYGNAGDLDRIWPNRGNARIVLANYSGDPAFPGKIAHQYTSQATVAPFGHPVDMNCADGLSMPALMAALGLTNPSPNNVGPVTPFPEEDDMFTDEDRAHLTAAYEALFGPKNGGATGPLSWENLDGSSGSSRYGLLPIEIYTQVLVSKQAGQLAALTELVKQLAAGGGTAIDMSAVQAAAEAGTKAALADISVTVTT
jgi:hypothetical protein